MPHLELYQAALSINSDFQDVIVHLELEVDFVRFSELSIEHLSDVSRTWQEVNIAAILQRQFDLSADIRRIR